MLVKIPEDRHWWFASRTRAIQSLVKGRPAPTGSRVLDIGCGAGNMTHHLASYGRVFGVEYFRKPLTVALARKHEVALAAAERLPVAQGTFTLVAALDVVEHCDDDLAVLRECATACQPGGRLILTVPAFPFLWSHNDEVNGHRRRYRATELRRKLASVGFAVERMTYNNFFIFPAAALLILLRRRLQEAPKLAAPSTDEEAYQVEMEPASSLANAVLGTLGRLEAAVLSRVDLPLGTGLICVARKR